MDAKKLAHPSSYLTPLEAHVFGPLYANPIRSSHPPTNPAQVGQDSRKPSPLADWGIDEEELQLEALNETPSANIDSPTSHPTPSTAKSPVKRGRPRMLESLLPLVEEFLRLKALHGPAAPTVAAYLNAVGNPCSERTFFTALKKIGNQ